MQELGVQQVHVTDAFWQPRLEMNARAAILHQWEQLEKTACIDNFRLVAQGKAGFRQGWFFSDSDAFKWLDAASRIFATQPSEALKGHIDALVDLIGVTQTTDGYLDTYNQIHFPGTRWVNLQIEHELYCHGHLIEAAVSHFQATGERRLLEVAEKAADLLVCEFSGAGPEATPGHEEIEIALLKLYRTTGKQEYLALAEHFLEQRGRMGWFAPLIFRQNQSKSQRQEWIARQRAQYLAEHPEYAAFELPPGNVARKPPGIRARYYLSAFTGKYLQQHRPVRDQRIPVGHAVRFAYLETALAMLARERGDQSLVSTLEKAWEHMVNRRMYVTGGIGSLPEIEGFGRDYELDPEFAYGETCAALGCLFWNWEMVLITSQGKYADLFEWQLYNAASVGMGLEGKTYLYNNPLACHGGVTRRAWYQVPCCPSNLSRTWASLGTYLYSYQDGELWVHQYVGSETEVDLGFPVHIAMESGLPWHGKAELHVSPASPAAFTLHLRIPSWSDRFELKINGQSIQPPPRQGAGVAEPPASGYAPQRAYYLPISRTWSPGDVVEVDFSMPLTIRRAHPKVRSVQGRVALTRGPLVYCLESVDNPDLDLFEAPIDLSTLRPEFSPAHLGGMWVLRGQTVDGQSLTAIPYFSWANRGPSQMTVWVRAVAKP